MISSQNLDIDGQGDSSLIPPPSLVNPMFSKNVKMTLQFHISGKAVTTGSTSIRVWMLTVLGDPHKSFITLYKKYPSIKLYFISCLQPTFPL